MLISIVRCQKFSNFYVISVSELQLLFKSFQGDTVTIAISHVSLEEESTAMNSDVIKQLFVEYKFLGIDPQETETPFSLPKPKPYHQIQFNFNKSKC